MRTVAATLAAAVWLVSVTSSSASRCSSAIRGRVEAGLTPEQAVLTIDLAPTLLELAGAPTR